jgi:hypothetical protein
MLSWHPTESAKCFALRPGIADEANFAAVSPYSAATTNSSS